MINNKTAIYRSTNYLVCVRCFTYNHAKYITEALNGFCMQETTFPYVCTIVDDASTDGEQDVINDYLQKNFNFNDKNIVRNEETDDYILTFARHKANKNCFFAVLYLKYNHYSIKKDKFPYIAEWHGATKYTALCEGDDYWTDPLKLQKQIDFMEARPDYGMVYTGHKQYIQQTGEIKAGWSKQSDLKDMFFSNKVCTLTTCFRSSIWLDYHKEIDSISKQRGWLMGDYPLWLYIMANSKAKYIPDVTGMYRRLGNSASNFTEYEKKKNFLISSFDVCKFFADKYVKSMKKSIAMWEIETLVREAIWFDCNLNYSVTSHFIKNRLFAPKLFWWSLIRSNKRIRNWLNIKGTDSN